MSGPLQVVLLLQLTIVSVVFLRALQRSALLSREIPRPQAPRRSGRPTRLSPSEVADRAAMAEELAALDAQRVAIATDLDRLRAAHTKEEAAFRARRREVMLDLHEQRRVCNELRAVEPELRSRVDALRADVEHLQRRRPALAAELRASVRSSRLLQGRLETARSELEALRRDRDRIHERLDEDKERLRDLARRRAVLRAETEELAALARTLQPAAGGPHLLARLTDGELRESRIRPFGERSFAADPSVPWDGRSRVRRLRHPPAPGSSGSVSEQAETIVELRSAQRA
jgi:chaperonin cofactor prefoldin